MNTPHGSTKLIYLASPYTHPDEVILERRFRAVCLRAADIMAEGRYVYSPIAHTHPIATHGALPKVEWEYWDRYSLFMLARCDRLEVLTIPGWKESRGVGAEIRHAEDLKLPIDYVDEELSLVLWAEA